MAIARWSPFDELTNFRTTMDRLFGESLSRGQLQTGDMPTFRLPVDITEDDNGYTLKAPVPGFNPEDVEVTVDGNVLTIQASRKEEKEDKKGSYLRREIIVGNFVRQIALPNDAKAENINATFDNGVLQIEVPRTAQPAPKRIEVKAGSQQQMAGASSR